MQMGVYSVHLPHLFDGNNLLAPEPLIVVGYDHKLH